MRKIHMPNIASQKGDVTHNRIIIEIQKILSFSKYFHFSCQSSEIPLSLKRYFDRLRTDQEGTKNPKT
ncbi:hypothetical protein CER18_06820 [Bartonella tribocorum]|uniref:Uncharacterized protein n=1 Tax=Bartonella tribocorum TaxID=85701 RepID=A0A2M6UQK2_9HYPH|nr:hypothetical protein CER18_06820 [Bartonella tribocorum]